jgi:hypothetical protein
MATNFVRGVEILGPSTPTPNTLQGMLVFDNGLPASGIFTRFYSVGFAARDVKLGETSSDSQGKYSILHTLPDRASLVSWNRGG